MCLVWTWIFRLHYIDVIMRAMASQITGVSIVCLTVYSDADQRKHQSSESLVSVRGIRTCQVTSPHKGLVTRKMFPLDDGVMFMSKTNHNDIFPDVGILMGPLSVILLWHGDAMGRRRSGSTLAWVTACCLTTPSHFLNQSWLIISGVGSAECTWEQFHGNCSRM